jgi:inositol oxygenase
MSTTINDSSSPRSPSPVLDLNDDDQRRQAVDSELQSPLKKAKGAQPDVHFALPKDACEFRNYRDSAFQEKVSRHYKLMRSNHCVELVVRMHEKYSFAEGKHRARYTIREVFKLLDDYVDSSDPDLGLPNFIHNFQTAEGIRGDGLPDWFQLVGLLHDMGKAMFALGGVKEDGQHGTAESPQWGLG